MAAPEATEKFINWITGLPMALFDATGSIFNGSGPTSSIGLVPDPGATPGTTRFLREDGTFAAPPGISPGTVTNAMLADVPSPSFKGRITALTGSPEDLTITEATSMLNAFTGDSGAGGVKGLVPAPAAGDAAANKFLNADGTFKATPTSNPALTLIASGSLSGAAVPLTSIPATYRFLVLVLAGASIDTANRNPQVSASVNNGVSYDTTAANYIKSFITDAGTVGASVAFSTFILNASFSAASTNELTMYLHNYIGGVYSYCNYYYMNSAASAIVVGTTYYRGSTSPIDALNIYINGSGNFDAGTYALYGGT